MPSFYHPKLPREQVVEHPYSPGHGWLRVDDDTSAPEQPAEPVNPESAQTPLTLKKEK